MILGFAATTSGFGHAFWSTGLTPPRRSAVVGRRTKILAELPTSVAGTSRHFAATQNSVAIG
jgi:hypothetical protein